ncbi:4Fe-4S binding protein [Adlercreutzia sp. ZJ242]|uniref:4Fe-4S binding protein n=1 Tax=Adlercreutzia sp. ZJ242 TaxID=2709409 RepID=UPI0013ED8272|nr:4Fe-4S binding protein [Adlercreutzia sp. ZJ242]
MKCALVQFSPTGGTERAASALCDGLGSVTQLVDLADPAFAPVEVDGSAEIAVIAVPSFGGRVPALAAERLASVRASGTPCVLMCVYGNRAYDDTLLELSDLAVGCGFEAVAAVSAIAEHSVVRAFAAGRPDATDVKALRAFAAEIARKVGAGERGMATALPGSPAYAKKKAGASGPYPKATSSCTKCGVCAAKCPAGAIDAANPKAPDTAKCASCMRCVSVCPSNSRKVSGLLTFAVSKAIGKACKERKECELFL